MSTTREYEGCMQREYYHSVSFNYWIDIHTETRDKIIVRIGSGD